MFFCVVLLVPDDQWVIFQVTDFPRSVLNVEVSTDLMLFPTANNVDGISGWYMLANPVMGSVMNRFVDLWAVHVNDASSDHVDFDVVRLESTDSIIEVVFQCGRVLSWWLSSRLFPGTIRLPSWSTWWGL